MRKSGKRLRELVERKVIEVINSVKRPDANDQLVQHHFDNHAQSHVQSLLSTQTVLCLSSFHVYNIISFSLESQRILSFQSNLLLLRSTENVSEIDMKHLTIMTNKNIIIMSITNYLKICKIKTKRKNIEFSISDTYFQEHTYDIFFITEQNKTSQYSNNNKSNQYSSLAHIATQ